MQLVELPLCGSPERPVAFLYGLPNRVGRIHLLTLSRGVSLGNVSSLPG